MIYISQIVYHLCLNNETEKIYLLLTAVSKQLLLRICCNAKCSTLRCGFFRHFNYNYCYILTHSYTFLSSINCSNLRLHIVLNLQLHIGPGIAKQYGHKMYVLCLMIAIQAIPVDIVNAPVLGQFNN